MKAPDIRTMDGTGVAFVLQPEPSRTREDAHRAGEEAVEHLQAALEAMANHPEILPERTPANDDDDMFRLVLSEEDVVLVLSRPGNSYRQMRLTIVRNDSRVVTCQVGSGLGKGTRAHFEASLRLFLHAARAAIDPADGDAGLDDLKATIVAMETESPLDYVLVPPLPWRAGEAFVRVKGMIDAMTSIAMPVTPFAAALTCVHDFQGVSIRVDPLTIETEADMDAMERLRLLRRRSLRAPPTTLGLLAA